MLGGMIDAMTTRVVAPLCWVALLIAGAMMLAAARRRHPVSGQASGSAPLTVHVATGLIVTAGLILLMPSSDLAAVAGTVVATTTDTPAHAHPGLAPAPLALATALVCGQVLITCVGVRTERAWRDRAHHLLMACSTVAMGLIIVT